MSFTLHPGAERDLGEAARFYTKEAGRGVAERFLDEFERVAALLVANPGLGIPTGGNLRWFPLHGFPIRSSIVAQIWISGSWPFGINTATQGTGPTAGETPFGRVLSYANLLAQAETRFFHLMLACDASPTPPPTISSVQFQRHHGRRCPRPECPLGADHCPCRPSGVASDPELPLGLNG